MIPVIDGHNDLAWHRRTTADYSVDGLDVESAATLHTDIPKIRRGGLAGQFWSVWVDTDLEHIDYLRGTLEQIDFVQRLLGAYPDVFGRATTADAVEREMAAGRVASLMGVEGSHQIGGSFGVLRDYARLGVRYMTLTWNVPTAYADANIGDEIHGGLSAHGRDLVAEMNRIGMVVDISHVSWPTMRDTLAASVLPVMFSHSSCSAINAHPRNVPDDVLASLASNGGVQMITFVPSFVSAAYWEWELTGEQGEAPTVGLADVVEHIEHARAVMGIDHIGLGGDYDGFVTPGPQGLEDASCYPALFEALAERGWSTEDLHQLGYRNALRVLHDNDGAWRAAGVGADS